MSEAFSVKGALTFGWNTFKTHPWVFIKVSLVYLAVELVLGIVQGMLPTFLNPLLGMAVGTFLAIGILAFYLKAHDDPAGAKIQQLWTPEPFLRYLVTSIIMGVLILIGFVLLIVPGVILALAWSFTPYLVIEKKMWLKDAFLESARLTRGSRVQLFLFGIVLTLINLLGMLALFIGLLVTVPVSLLASVHVYRTLSKKAAQPAEVSAIPSVPEPVAEAAPAA